MPNFRGFFFRRNQQGQAFLIVVLVMVVALTVGLSIASRSISNLKITSEQANSQKAFFAAEAGVEQALKTGQNITSSQSLGNSSEIDQVAIQTIESSSLLLNNGNPIIKDDGAEVWLTNYSTISANLYKPPYWNGNITIYWGATSNSCNEAGIEVLVITGTKASPSIARYAVDPCSLRRSQNSFAVANGGGAVNGKNFFFSSAPISVTSGLIMRITPLYANSPIGIVAGNGSDSLPPQAQIITSTGISGNTQRKIVYYQAYESLPSEFFYSLFSP